MIPSVTISHESGLPPLLLSILARKRLYTPKDFSRGLIEEWRIDPSQSKPRTTSVNQPAQDGSGGCLRAHCLWERALTTTMKSKEHHLHIHRQIYCHNQSFGNPWETIATVGLVQAVAVSRFHLTTERDFWGVYLHWLGLAWLLTRPAHSAAMPEGWRPPAPMHWTRLILG
ncbi:hypothetical protein TNCV_295701 [Trichonephila clavipes]|nr:hypothetical protein TNCV_295701 [Trichonephila clavipes]